MGLVSWGRLTRQWCQFQFRGARTSSKRARGNTPSEGLGNRWSIRSSSASQCLRITVGCDSSVSSGRTLYMSSSMANMAL